MEMTVNCDTCISSEVTESIAGLSIESHAKNEVPVVEIAYSELSSADADDKHVALKKARSQKRPDVARYVPGSRRSNTKAHETPVVDTTQQTDAAHPEPATSAEKRKKKRPEVQVYVPKRREKTAERSPQVDNEEASQSPIDTPVSSKAHSKKTAEVSGITSKSTDLASPVNSDITVTPTSHSDRSKLNYSEPNEKTCPPAPSGQDRRNKNKFPKESQVKARSEVSTSSSGSKRYTDKRRQRLETASSESDSQVREQSDVTEERREKPKAASPPEVGKQPISNSRNSSTKPYTARPQRSHDRKYSEREEPKSAHAVKEPLAEKKSTESSARNRSNKRGSKGRESSFASNSRLFDPYNEKKEKSNEPANKTGTGGLLKLPKDVHNRIQPTDSAEADNSLRFPVTESSSRGHRMLYDPDNPMTSLQIHTDTVDSRMLGGGDYVIPSSGVVCPPEAYRGMLSPNFPQTYYCSEYSYSMEDDYCTPRSGGSSKQNAIKQTIKEAVLLERELSAHVSRRLHVASLEQMHKHRLSVRDKLEQVLVHEVELSVNNNLDQLLWRTVYHQLIEMFRRELREDVDEDLAQQLNGILEEGERFYKELIANFECSSRFSLADYSGVHRPAIHPRGLKLCLLLSQSFLISLGDIARYQALHNGTQDFGIARRYYMQASHVLPKNGKTYNQLAIIAMHAKRKLDTVFYFARAIVASNAFLSAKETLRGIYHDVMKKYEQTKLQDERAKAEKLEQRGQNDRRAMAMNNGSSYRRLEVWISPLDGSSTSDHVDDDADDKSFSQMPCSELYKRLMGAFLCCQGYLFSRVGMEYFPDVSSDTLHLLRALLSHSPIPHLDITKFIQMFTIAMFTIQHAGLSANPVPMENEQCRSYIQEQAISLLLDMLAVLVDRCISSLEATELITVKRLTAPDFLVLLPIIKLATDWMTCHPSLWNPVPCPRDPELGPVLDLWQSLSTLSNMLSKVDTLQFRFYDEEEYDGMPDEDKSEHVWLLLRETQELNGFLPLMNLAADQVFISKCDDSTEACQCYRVTKLVQFADYLCGIEPPMLEFDTHSSRYLSLVASPSLSEKTEPRADNSTLPNAETDQDSNVVVQSESDEGDDDEENELKALRRKKRQLTKQLTEQRRQEQAHQAMLQKESYTLCLEVRPVFLVPDTNCFIEYLAAMERLIASRKFTVIVPLIVINELDGLSKNIMVEKYGSEEHSRQVVDEATKTISFLEEQFESRNHRLKALTANGTELESITYRSEEITSTGNNDDRILSCCLKYCTDNARDYMPKDKDETVTLHRDVVLLTDDRNLRLKAHTRNVPVKDLLHFMKWAKL